MFMAHIAMAVMWLLFGIMSVKRSRSSCDDTGWKLAYIAQFTLMALEIIHAITTY